MTDSQSSVSILNPRRGVTAMELRIQQKKRRSQPIFKISNNLSQQTNKEDENDEFIKEKTIVNESSGKTVKEILGKGNTQSMENIRSEGGQMSGENSNSMKMFNSQFDNFYQVFQKNNVVMQDLQRRQSSQQTQKKDQKQQIVESKDNFLLVNEISLISGVNFEWFKDLFSSSGVFSGYDISKYTKESFQMIKQQIRKTLQIYKYEKSQSILSGFNSQFNKEKTVMKNQETFVTMRDCFQNFLHSRSNHFYYLTSQFTILFIHQNTVENNNSNQYIKSDKDRIVAVVQAKSFKSFDIFLKNEGIEFTDISELQRKQKEEYQLQEKKKRQKQENFREDLFEEDEKINFERKIRDMNDKYKDTFLNSNEHSNDKSRDKNKFMDDEDTQTNLPFQTIVDNKSTVLLIKKKYVQSLWNSLINQNLETEKDNHNSFQKMEIISNFAFEHSYKCNLKEYFNGQIISSDVQQYTYLFDEMDDNKYITKPKHTPLDDIFQSNTSNILYNLKLKGEIPFPQIKELVDILKSINVNFAIFYHENTLTQYFKGDIIKFEQ